MHISTDSGDVASATVTVNPGSGEPFATVDIGRAYLRLESVADAEALMIAAANAKRRLLAAISGTPHEWIPATEFTGYTTHCDTCGLLHGHAIHEVPAACAVPGCGHARDSHWEHGEPQGPRTGCSALGCKCQGYADVAGAADPEASAILAEPVASGTPLIITDDVADPAEAADPGYLEDAAAQDDEALPDCDRIECRHPEEAHLRHGPEPIAAGKCQDGNDTALGWMSCKCTAYQLPADDADPAYPDVPGGGVPCPPRSGFVSASAPVLLGAKVRTGGTL